MTVKQFNVKGMTCNGCAGTVSNILKMQDGVEEVDVRYPENDATVTYQESKITEDRMVEIVRAMGYELIP